MIKKDFFFWSDAFWERKTFIDTKNFNQKWDYIFVDGVQERHNG